MFVTEDGIVTDTSDGQSANAHSPSDLTEEGITTETNAVPQKVLYPIVSTWSRFTDFRDEQELQILDFDHYAIYTPAYRNTCFRQLYIPQDC